MKTTIILILIAIVSVAFGVLAFVENIKTKKELKAKKKQEKENAKIDKETIENIGVVSGDDIHAGNNILHNLAEKRK